MKKLTIYILGMITVLTFIPLIESLTEIICSWLEVGKAIPMKKVLKINNEIQDLQAQLEQVSTNAIGFIQNDNYDEWDDDDWEEDKIKNKTSMGFK